jgi:hypothetical protein
MILVVSVSIAISVRPWIHDAIPSKTQGSWRLATIPLSSWDTRKDLDSLFDHRFEHLLNGIFSHLLMPLQGAYLLYTVSACWTFCTTIMARTRMQLHIQAWNMWYRAAGRFAPIHVYSVLWCLLCPLSYYLSSNIAKAKTQIWPNPYPPFSTGTVCFHGFLSTHIDLH